MSDSTLQAKGNAIYAETATDLSAAIGKLVTFSAGVPSVNASATVPAVGVVLDARKRQAITGGATYYDNAIGVLGALPGPVRALINASSAPLSFGDTLQQAADGTLTKDLGPGNARVVVAVMTDLNGANPGDDCEVTFFTPQIRS
jgi:hypothetical protein